MRSGLAQKNPEDGTEMPLPAGDSATGSRAEILAAAADCFKSRGFSATSIDDVARLLGATKGMIYHHFRSKMDLFFAVYRRGMEINFAASRPAFEGDGDALTRLARMGMAHSIALMEHQSFQRVLGEGVAMHQTGSTTAAQRETLLELIELRNSYETMFRRAIEQAADEGGFELRDSSLASKNFLAVMNSTVFWYSPRKGNVRGQQIDLAQELVRFAMLGLGATVPENVIENWEN